MAITLTAAQLTTRTGALPADAPGLLAAVSELVMKYAPDAPDTLQNEAVVRLGGYLATADYGAVVEQEFGSSAVRHRYVVNHAAMFTSSGAAAILAPWRVRRVGAV